MLRAQFQRKWRKTYETVSVCLKIPRTSPLPYPLPPTPPPPPPPKRPVDKWMCRRKMYLHSSLQLHNSWGVLHISRHIWLETDSALDNDLINSRNKNFKPLETPRQRHIHILWKRDARHDPGSSAAVAQRTFFSLRLLTRMNPGILLCCPYFVKK